MQNTQKGFIVPALISIIVLLLVGGGAYVYTLSQNKNTENKVSDTLPKNVDPSTYSKDQNLEEKINANTDKNGYAVATDMVLRKNDAIGFSIYYQKDTVVVNDYPSTIIFRPRNTAAYLTVTSSLTACGDSSGADLSYKTINGTKYEVYNLDRVMSTELNKSVSARQYCIQRSADTFKIIATLPYLNQPLDVDTDTTINKMIESIKLETN